MTDHRLAAHAAERMATVTAIAGRNGRHGHGEPALAVEKAPCWADLFPGLALDDVELFTDQYGEAYALTSDAGGRQTLRLRSDAFRNWLIRRYVDAKLRPGLRGIRDDIAVMTAMAGLDTRELHNRSALPGDRSSLYIDLADAFGRMIKVEAGRWQVIDDATVRFRRQLHQEPLPEPDRGGDLRKVLDLLPPFRSESEQLLVLTWTVCALVPFPRPILMLVGDPGSGKTTMSRVLRRLVDPSKGDLLGQDGRADLPLTFAQHAVPAFDNVDALSKRESDLFCRGVTGGAVARRRLYTDSDEFVWRFQRAVIMSSLAPPTNRPDFLDRSLIIGLDRMAPERRQALSGLEAAFEAAWPSLFGGVLNALSDTLALLPRVPEGNLSRMADFHRFGRAAAVALGWTPQLFDAAMREAEAAPEPWRWR